MVVISLAAVIQSGWRWFKIISSRGRDQRVNLADNN